MRCFAYLALFGLLLTLGCQSPLPQKTPVEKVQKEPFLQNGVTTKDKVLSRLGPPDSISRPLEMTSPFFAIPAPAEASSASEIWSYWSFDVKNIGQLDPREPVADRQLLEIFFDDQGRVVHYLTRASRR